MAILARGREPVLTRSSLPGNPEDRQARYIEAAVNGVLIASIYLPNGNPQPGPKFDYKLAWFERLIAHAAELMTAGVPVVLAGDYNVVPTVQDIYPTRSLDNNALIQPESRAGLFAIVSSRLDRCAAEVVSGGAALDVLGLQARALAGRQGHAARSLAALASVVGATRRRRCGPMGARRGKRQRSRSGVDNARSLIRSRMTPRVVLVRSAWAATHASPSPAAANAQLFPRQKFAIEQQRIATRFETSSGRRASSTSSRIKARFPAIETRPFER